MNKTKLRNVVVANAGAVVGVCLVLWVAGSRANRMISIGIGVIGILILNVALVLGHRVTRKSAEPNRRSHFGSILMLILILFAVFLHFIAK
jgi:NAD/NADP transhydrogenase alpha subunit